MRQVQLPWVAATVASEVRGPSAQPRKYADRYRETGKALLAVMPEHLLGAALQVFIELLDRTCPDVVVKRLIVERDAVLRTSCNR